MKTKLYSVLTHSRALKSLLLGALMVCGTMVSAQTFTIFGLGDVPDDQDENDGQPIEVGVKFHVTQIGSVSAIRFYQNASDVGTHTANLYDINGNLLSTSGPVATAPGAGWRQIALPAPVNIGTTIPYVASVFNPSGVYGVSNPYFGSLGEIGDDPLYALSTIDTTYPGNGVYNFGGPGFPTTTFGSSNYFVDVVFTTTFPLPVRLAEFKAVDKNYDVNLSWVTSLEQNNLGFEVQRSIDGTNFEALGFVDGAGESNSKKTYAYTDRNLEPGMYFYRLNQVDHDGRSKFSPVVTANVKRSNQAILYQGFPNPVKGQATIQYVLPRSMQVTLSVYDLNGRLVQILDNGTKQTGSHTVQLDASVMQKGVYICKLEADGELAGTSKLIVQ